MLIYLTFPIHSSVKLMSEGPMQDLKSTYKKSLVFVYLLIFTNFIKNILDKNFNVILDHIENKIEKDVFLNDVNANM